MPDGSPPIQNPTQPHNIEAEQALLGALLLNNEIFDRISATIQPHHFYDPVHGRIFEAASSRIQRNTLASPVTLKSVFADDEGLAELGGTDYLARLAGAAVSIVAARDYAQTILDLSIRRDLIRVGEEMQVRATDFTEENEDPQQQISAAEDVLADLRKGTETEATVHTFAQALSEGMTWANDNYQRGGVPEITTGLNRLDKVLGGLGRGRMLMLGGRTAMGKTAMGLEIALGAAEAGTGVAFLSLEMSKGEVSHRAVSRALARKGVSVPYQKIATGDMDEGEFHAALEISRDMERLPLWTSESNARELPRLRAAVRRAEKGLDRMGHPLGLIVVDYLQLVQAADKRLRDTERVSLAAREMKNLARDMHVPVIVLAQVKREVEDRPDRRPRISDIRWAGEAEEAADQVMFVYRASYYLHMDAKAETDGAKRSELIQEANRLSNVLEINVPKNRGGPTGSCTLWCDIGTNDIRDEGYEERRQAENQEGFDL